MVYFSGLRYPLNFFSELYSFINTPLLAAAQWMAIKCILSVWS